MNRYWLAQNGETTGPYAQEVLVEMWNRGQVLINAHVCLEGLDDWLDAKFMVNELEIAKEQAARDQSLREQRMATLKADAERRFRRGQKSRAVAFVLNLIMPGLGQVYCGYWLEALLLFAVACAVAWGAIFLGVPVVLGVVVLVFALTGYEAAKRRNVQLAEDLGL